MRSEFRFHLPIISILLPSLHLLTVVGVFTLADRMLIKSNRPSIDAELPIECDDEYWETEDPNKAFVQPPDKPSRITFFNCYLRLNNLLASALKMLVSRQSNSSGLVSILFAGPVPAQQGQDAAFLSRSIMGGEDCGGARLGAQWVGRFDTGSSCVHFLPNPLN